MSYVESQFPQDIVENSLHPTVIPFPLEKRRQAKEWQRVEASSYTRVKPTVDWLLALAMTAVASPVLLIIAGAIAVLHGRPIFYWQTRVGKSGKTFSIVKFRTMRTDAENRSGAVWCNRDDDRITWLGRYLRASHLDELPQLWNILRGDMSLIGPRPERPEFVEHLSEEIPCYEDRHQVRPGITGLAQIKQGYDGSINDVRRKVEFDLDYIESVTFLQDLQILAMTIPYVTNEVASLLVRRLQGMRSTPETAPRLAASSLIREGDILRFDVAVQDIGQYVASQERHPLEEQILAEVLQIDSAARSNTNPQTTRLRK